MRRTTASTSFRGLVFDAAPGKRQFPPSAPPEGTCTALSSPTFTHSSELIWHERYSLLGRVDTALKVSNPGGISTIAKSNKRKINGAGQPPAARPRSDGAAQRWSFVISLERDGTPAEAFYFAWRGLKDCNARATTARAGMGRFAKRSPHVRSAAATDATAPAVRRA